MKALVGAFNQEKALVGAFSVIVKTGCGGTDGSFYSTSCGQWPWSAVEWCTGAGAYVCHVCQVPAYTGQPRSPVKPDMAASHHS